MDIKIKPTVLQFQGRGVKLRIKKIVDSTEVKFSLWLGKNKLSELPDHIGVKRRVFEGYNGKLPLIEQYLWQRYFKKLFGTGDFYSYKKAVELVEQSEFKKNDINNMLRVLRGVAYYKGVDKYLLHVAAGDSDKEFMQNIKSKSTADRYISMLQRQELRINPVTIGKGVLGKAENMIVDERIPGLLTVLEQNDVTKYKPRPWKLVLKSEDESFEEYIEEFPEEYKEMLYEQRKEVSSVNPEFEGLSFDI